MSAKSKIYKIGKEIVEARNMGEALGLRRALEAEGRLKPGAIVVEHTDQAAKPTFGKTIVVEPKEAPIGKVKMAPAVAVPAISANPLDSLKDLGQAWQSNVVDPVAGALKDTLTPPVAVQGQEFQTASPVSDMILESAADPINYVPGGAGAVLGAAEMAAGYAEGGEVTDDGSIPLDQFEVAPSAMGTEVPGEGIDIDQFETREDKYGTPGQQAITALEGLAEGVAGPLATLAETKLLGVKESDVLARRQENPITFGAGQATGLVGGLLTGVGEGALLAKAGQAAAQATGLAKGTSYAARVGSEVARQAAEMAVLQSTDEISKMILKDPDTSAESALGHIGLSSALGGVGGLVFAGAVNPLWKATVGPQLENMLSKMTNRINGQPLAMKEETEAALGRLGLDVAPEIRAGISGDEAATELFGRLKEAQSPKILQGIEKLHYDTSEAVAKQLGIDPSDIQSYSNAEAGNSLLDAFKREYKAKYEPLEAAFNKRNAEAATISIPDNNRLKFYGDLLEEGMNRVGTDSPSYKLYKEYGDRVLARESVGQLDQLRTEIGRRIEGLKIADPNGERAILQDIRNTIGDFQESQIAKQGKELGADALSAELLNERAEVNRRYKEFAQISRELSDNLGIGNKFSGAKSLENKLSNNVTAEQLLNKFSIRNNAEFIPFLQQYFPETLNQVKAHELKELLKPAVLKAKGDIPLDVKKLADTIDKGMAGKREYIESLLTPEALSAIQAGRTILDAVPNPKSSGTAGWMTKMFDKMPASVLGAVAMIQGGNPLLGGLMGHSAQLLAVDAPNALRLSYLKFLGSNQPIKAEGFKAMVDFMKAAAKGEHQMVKSTKAVLKSGAQVIPNSMYPTEKDNEKLDKTISKMMDQPDRMMRVSESDVGHYLPDHQIALALGSTRAAQYLQDIKPQPHKLGALDKPVPPTDIEIARYNRALTIANQPLTILDKVKQGTILPSDIKDLHAMYPKLYQQMAAKLTNEMAIASDNGETIPYQTRMGLSLFLGTPVDSTMQPLAIQAAQPKPKPMGQQQAGGIGGNPQRKGAASQLGKKTNQMYMTQGQSAEADRNSR